MLNIILATARPEAIQAFVGALSSDPQVNLKRVASGAETLTEVRTLAPHLVIVDSNLADTEPLVLVQKLLQVNAMVNTAVISPLSDEDFHEASEGLGILGRLPLAPAPDDATALIRKLRRIQGLGG